MLVGRTKINVKDVTRKRAQIVSLLKLECSQKTDPRGLKKVGAESEDFEEVQEVAKKYCDAHLN